MVVLNVARKLIVVGKMKFLLAKIVIVMSTIEMIKLSIERKYREKFLKFGDRIKGYTSVLQFEKLNFFFDNLKRKILID